MQNNKVRGIISSYVVWLIILSALIVSPTIDAQTGTRIADGRYLMPLSFLMYGDWQVDVRLDFAGAGKKHLRFVVKFFP